MKLQELIMCKMGVIDENDKKVMSDFIMESFQNHPTLDVEIDTYAYGDNVSTRRYAGRNIMSVPETKLDSTKEWLESEGFALKNVYSPGGRFVGYRIFLKGDYMGF